ncbi:MAG TPA: lysylphosphatidylglycerol synthase domain-containing protein [Alphaproteobacteria bacterium]|nr:lysylphosphatidylglycerol synthase domain-containing protein [Alphaproteobacteria bacterium]
MRSFVKFLPLFVGLFGLAAALWLIAHEGPERIIKTFAQAGWGAAFVAFLHFPHMVLAGRGWQILWPKGRRPPLMLFTWVLWVREAVNSLLPVARIGGEVAALSILRRYGLPLSSGVGSLVVETTLSVLTTFVFVLMGLLLLALSVPGYGQMLQWGLGLLAAFLLLTGAITLQRYGAFRLASRVINFLGGGKWQHLVEGGARLDRAVRAFYGRPARLISCGLWSLASWFVGAFEFWVALHLLHHPVPFTDAIILEAMIHATGSAAFFMPASLGIQEGTLLFFGQMLGLPGEVCLALALVRRCRDVLVMLPGLIIWQVQEGHSFLAKFLKKG